MRTVFLAMAAVTVASGAMAQETLPVAKPIGSPGEWIPLNSYPAAAKASAEEGRVAFTLTVDEAGRASDCKVTATSESPLLDETTCNLMLANARFTPARDKKGRPTESRWSSSVRWKLETPPPPVPAPVAPIAPAVPAPVKR